jgi:hypothetical protein
MLVISVITMLCTAGIAFYLRFLLALCKELTPRWISNRKPHRLRLEEKRTGNWLSPKPRHSRAALQITELPLNTTLRELRRDRA